MGSSTHCIRFIRHNAKGAKLFVSWIFVFDFCYFWVGIARFVFYLHFVCESKSRLLVCENSGFFITNGVFCNKWTEIRNECCDVQSKSRWNTFGVTIFKSSRRSESRSFSRSTERIMVVEAANGDGVHTLPDSIFSSVGTLHQIEIEEKWIAMIQLTEWRWNDVDGGCVKYLELNGNWWMAIVHAVDWETKTKFETWLKLCSSSCINGECESTQQNHKWMRSREFGEWLNRDREWNTQFIGTNDRRSENE